MFKNWFRLKADAPSFRDDYLRYFERSHPMRTPVEAISFVVFDTETTGLNVRQDRLLSIGAVRVQNWQINIADTFECLILQEHMQLGNSPKIHGILGNTLQRMGIEETEAVRQFSHYCQNSVLVGHHIAFDRAMMEKVLRPMTGTRLRNYCIDTIRLAQRLAPPSIGLRPQDFSLDQLCRQYHIEAKDRHTAAGDAYITALLFLKLLARLQKRGVRTLRDLLR